MVDSSSRRAKFRRGVGVTALSVVVVGIVGMGLFGSYIVFGLSIGTTLLLGPLWVLLGYTRATSTGPPEDEVDPVVDMLAEVPAIERRRGKTLEQADTAIQGAVRGTLPAFKVANVVALVEDAVYEEVVKIPSSEGLLEEEPISGTSFRYARLMSVFFGAMAVFFGSEAVFGSMASNLWVAVVFLILAAMPWWSRIEGRSDAARIVGAGWVRVTKGRKKGVWTVGDALLWVRQASPYSKTIRVSVVGQNQTLKLSFDSVADPEFIVLWQRWTGTPRLELLED